MSKENAKKFYEALKTDKALAEELQNALKAQKIENEEKAKQAVIAFAGNKGFAFTAAELAELESEVRELSDDELDQVSAAGIHAGNTGGCFVGGGGKGANAEHGWCALIGDNSEGKFRCFIVGCWK